MNYNEIMVAQAKSQVLRELGIDNETTKTVVLPETTAQSDNDWFSFPAISLNLGEKCVVVMNGTTYHTECFGIDGVIAIGNQAEANGGISTGEPFTFIVDDGVLACCVFNPDTFEPSLIGTLTLEIYQETTTTTPIKPEYLPGVCLPVVELKTTITNGAILTDAESAALNKAAEQMVPIIVRFTIAGGFPLSLMFQCADLGKIYGVAFGDIIVEFTKDDDNGPWNIMVDGL